MRDEFMDQLYDEAQAEWREAASEVETLAQWETEPERLRVALEHADRAFVRFSVLRALRPLGPTS